MTKDQIEKAIADAEALTAKLREMLPIEPAKPRFAVGDKVRIIGPSVYGRTDLVGIQVAVDYVSRRTSNLDINLGDAGIATYPASSLAPIAEVPAPKFKRGDVLQKNPNGPRLKVDQISWTGTQWLYTHFKSDQEHITVAERYLSPAKPSYLPTRWVNVKREKSSTWYDTGYVRDECRPTPSRNNHAHAIHDMPADKDGVQVDFVTLTEAGYAVAESIEKGRFFWNHNFGQPEYHATAIDAWRAAAVHYLVNKK